MIINGLYKRIPHPLSESYADILIRASQNIKAAKRSRDDSLIYEAYMALDVVVADLRERVGVWVVYP